MRISAIKLHTLFPFKDTYFEFPTKSDDELGEVQIITGQNGTGKTRLLCVAASMLGNNDGLAQRIRGESDVSVAGAIEFMGGTAVWWLSRGSEDAGVLEQQGDSLEFVKQFSPASPAKYSYKFKLNPNDRREIPLRNLLARVRKRLAWAALAVRGTRKVSDSKVEALKSIPAGGHKKSLDFDDANHSDLICQAMTNLKMTSAMEFLSSDGTTGRSARMVEQLERAISDITGKPFTFDVITHPEIRIRVKWGDERLRFGALPDGLRSIIGWLVTCVATLSVEFPDHESPLEIPTVILLDEPETHLHPEWQRRIIPATQRLLRNSQILVVTHSPFIISSVNSGFVHVLREVDGRVATSPPRECSDGDTYLDATEDVLGMHSWYDPESETLLNQFTKMRTRFLGGQAELEALESLAVKIGRRSDSLKQMMGKEMQQVRRIQKENRENAESESSS